MIQAYRTENGLLLPVEGVDGAIWLDLVAPEVTELAHVGARLGIELPTREDMAEIELTSRTYAEDGALVTTFLLPAHADTDRPEMSPVSFVLVGGRLVTIRDHEPRPFASFARRAERAATGCATGEAIFTELLDAVVDRLADVLERVAREIDALSRRVFDDRRTVRKGHGYRPVLQEIGRKGDLVSNIRESLVTLERGTSFILGHARSAPGLKPHRDALRAVASDVRALSEHADAMNQKINFLLDATLGLVSLEQNAIMASFSVVAVVFLPPTLVASIYGMNFEVMPELSWPFGYPLALGVMLASAVLPYLWFRRKGWL